MAVWTPDVLVTDIRMARMTGLELMLRVRQAQRAIGIVAMSEMATARDAAVATQLGADRFLLKPLARPELLAAIESARDVPERVRPRQLAVPAATSMRTADDRSARARRSSVRTVTRRWSPSSLPFVRLTARRS
jgi:CheY-like chemotaxis protein